MKRGKASDRAVSQKASHKAISIIDRHSGREWDNLFQQEVEEKSEVQRFHLVRADGRKRSVSQFSKEKRLHRHLCPAGFVAVVVVVGEGGVANKHKQAKQTS